MDLTKFKKIVNSIFGVLLILPNVLVIIGVIQADAVPGLTEGLTSIQGAIVTIVQGVAGIILLFTGGEALSAKNLL